MHSLTVTHRDESSAWLQDHARSVSGDTITLYNLYDAGNTHHDRPDSRSMNSFDKSSIIVMIMT
jgi:hypothetical protein